MMRASAEAHGWKTQDPQGQKLCEEACEALYRDSCVIATLGQKVSDLFTRMKMELRQRDGAKLKIIIEDLQAAIAATTSMARTCHDNERVGMSLLQRLAFHCDANIGQLRGSRPSKDNTPWQPLQHHVDELQQALLAVGNSLHEEATREERENFDKVPNRRSEADSFGELPWDHFPTSTSKARSSDSNKLTLESHKSSNAQGGQDQKQQMCVERIQGEHDLCMWMLNVVQSDISELRLSHNVEQTADAGEIQLQWKVQELQDLLHECQVARKKESLCHKAANAELRRRLQDLTQQCTAHVAHKDKLQRELAKSGERLQALIEAGQEEQRKWEQTAATEQQRHQRFAAQHEHCVDGHASLELQGKYESLLQMSSALQSKYERLVQASLQTTSALEEQLAEKEALVAQLRLEASTEVCSA